MVLIDYAGRNMLSLDALRWCYTATTIVRNCCYVASHHSIDEAACYEGVKRIYSERRADLFLDQEEQEDKSMRIVFELGEFIPLGEKRVDFSYSRSDNTFTIPNIGAFMPLKQLRAKYEQIINGVEV